LRAGIGDDGVSDELEDFSVRQAIGSHQNVTFALKTGMVFHGAGLGLRLFPGFCRFRPSSGRLKRC
jgi:hypothetical protein